MKIIHFISLILLGFIIWLVWPKGNPEPHEEKPVHNVIKVDSKLNKSVQKWLNYEITPFDSLPDSVKLRYYPFYPDTAKVK